MQNYYKLLGVSRTAELAEIKIATQQKITSLRQRLVDIAHHPQHAEMKELISEGLQQIKTAYTVLSDPQQRQRYDSELERSDDVPMEEQPSNLLDSEERTEFPEDSPYHPPSAPISDLRDGEFELADRGTRLIAHIVDNIIYTVPMIILLIIGIDFGAIEQFLNHSQSGNDSQLAEQLLRESVSGILGLLIGVVYLIILASNLVLLYRGGQTIGKFLLSIKIVKTDGSRAGLTRIILLRVILFSFVTLIPFIGQLIYYLIDPLFIFQDSRRCLHDLVAGTIVVKAK
jgi:uncharacterized RDD family membrane protein YckC